MKTGNTILGIATGVAAGVILGVLFAPDKGKNTRTKIVNKTKDLKDSTKDSIMDLMSSVESKINTIASKTSGVIEENIDNLKKMNSNFKAEL